MRIIPDAVIIESAEEKDSFSDKYNDCIRKLAFEPGFSSIGNIWVEYEDGSLRIKSICVYRDHGSDFQKSGTICYENEDLVDFMMKVIVCEGNH